VSKDLRQRRETFNRSAEWYDRIRPGYPAALADAVLALSGIPAAGRILEIGCGTGKATELFASRGYEMVCLDIGADIAAVAAAKFRSSANVQIVVCSFEDWKSDGQPFDLVMAATSLHWVDPAIAYVKSATMLRPGGSLAVFSNEHIRQDEGFFQRVQDVYGEFAPSMARVPGNAEKPVGEPAGLALFSPAVERRYQWTIKYSAAEYVDLIGTYSDHIVLPEAQRLALFRGIADLIDREYAGKVLKHYETVLRLLKKRPSTSI
jgi:ubiquinone/menaquinone biosynthesis C-methylase UbiE